MAVLALSILIPGVLLGVAAVMRSACPSFGQNIRNWCWVGDSQQGKVKIFEGQQSRRASNEFYERDTPAKFYEQGALLEQGRPFGLRCVRLLDGSSMMSMFFLRKTEVHNNVLVLLVIIPVLPFALMGARCLSLARCKLPSLGKSAAIGPSGCSALLLHRIWETQMQV